MKRFIGVSFGAWAFVVTLGTGCGEKHSGEAEHAHQAEAGVSFSAKTGLSVPPETAKLIGLQVADVEERKMASTFQFSAQVYCPASETRETPLHAGSAPLALASGKVPSVDATRLREGQRVAVRSDEISTPCEARITALTHHLEEASGQVEVVLAISDTQQKLALGVFVSGTVPFGGETSVATVPRSSVLRTSEGEFVYTVSGEHFVRTAIRLGAANTEFTEVLDGLYVGDRVVVQPVMTLWMAELQSLRGGKACAGGH